MERTGLGWGSDPDFPIWLWKAAVADGDTRKGYVEWVEQKKDEEEAEREHDISSCGDA